MLVYSLKHKLIVQETVVDRIILGSYGDFDFDTFKETITRNTRIPVHQPV